MENIAFPLYGMYPTVLQLQVHLPNFHSIEFEDGVNLEDVLQDERLKRTMLTEFFTTDSMDEEARGLNLLYKELHKFYIWDDKLRTWTSRKRGISIGRLCTVNPIENERYYLRVLLNNVRSPTSFDYLLTFNGICCNFFQEAAHKRGLLHNDDDIE
ncbi:hypothetical protein LIER_10850 [Lithospermum erythrorhizon]|uniref:Uncharacterized protein n=1 Tax=Lithospermum erythrorhizon TaxID=34254 RepID=A0AAV3PKR9_LITER